MPADWWLKKTPYLLFMVRELTCLAVGGYALLLLLLVGAAAERDAFLAFADWLKSPLSIALHLLALPLLLFHSITWINLTPKVLVVWRGEERVSPALINGANYAAWMVVSLVIVWIALG